MEEVALKVFLGDVVEVNLFPALHHPMVVGRKGEGVTVRITNEPAAALLRAHSPCWITLHDGSWRRMTLERIRVEGEWLFLDCADSIP